MSTIIPDGLILGHCVLCGSEFRVVANVNLSRDEELWFAGNGEHHQFLYISRLTHLMVLGWLVLGQQNDILNNQVKQVAGTNLREFTNSSICQTCFPSDDEQTTRRNKRERNYEANDRNGVHALLIEPNGNSQLVQVSDQNRPSDILNCSDIEYYYSNGNGIFAYYSLENVLGTETPNVFCSALCNSYVAGSCLIVSDLDSDGLRQSDYTDLTQDWFEPIVSKMIQTCNTDQNARNFLQKHKPNS